MLTSSDLSVRVDNLGPFARGSNQLMYPFQASTGLVYLGTYGPRPAKFYEIDPESGEYSTHEPGDYQLRMIAETSDGHIWTISNYDSMFYEFSPQEGRFIGAYQCPPVCDQMICITDAQDRLYTVKERRLLRFDTRRKAFEDLGAAMPDWPPYNRGQHAQFGPDGKLYSITDCGVIVFDPGTGELRQVVAQDALGPDIQIMLGNLHAGGLQIPWLHGYAWVSDMAADHLDEGVHFSHNLLFRCNVETGAVETCPMAGGELGHCGWFYDPVGGLHYYGVPEKGRLVLRGYDWDRREVRREIVLPYGDSNGLVGQSRKPRHLLLSISWLGVLVEVNLDTGEHRKLFENPQPVEVRNLAVAPGRTAFGVTYDCGHVFRRDTSTAAPGNSIGLSYLFRVCYGPAGLTRDGNWLAYPINCAMAIRGTGLIPTEGAASGVHLTDLVPVHILATRDDEFLVVHRGPCYVHQEEGSWDGTDETVPALREVGVGVYRLACAASQVTELPQVPVGSMAALADGAALICDGESLWRLAAGAEAAERLGPAPAGALRLASSPDGKRVVLATGEALLEIDPATGAVGEPMPLGFAPERGLFVLATGGVIAVGRQALALLPLGSRELRAWAGELPGRVGPIAAPDEEALYAVHKELHRLTWS